MEAPRAPIVAWWDRLSRGQRVAVAILGFVVGLNVALIGLRSAIGGGNPGGPVSSSYSTGGGGLEAYSDLARASGHPVVRLKERPEVGSLPIGSTVVLADPRNLSVGEQQAVARFVVDGGRLVVAGESADLLLQAATGSAVSVVQTEPVDPLIVGDSTIGAVRTLAGDSGGRWSEPQDLEVVLSDREGRPLIVSAPVEEGTVVAVADATLLHNANLASHDNAALALELIGGSERQVVFVESVHGYATTGIDALPPSWKWAALGLVVALVFGLWWAGSRFGPPEPQARALRPARLDHVRAVAADLERVSTRPADLVGPLLSANRARLAERLGVRPDASIDVWRAAADRSGTDPDVVEAGTTVPSDLEGALYVGALAAHHRRAESEPVDLAVEHSPGEPSRPLSPHQPGGTVAGSNAP